MKLYLLTAATIGESESPVCIGTDLDAVKDAAVLPERYAPDDFNLYEAENGAMPRLIMYNPIRQTWDIPGRRSIYTLGGWQAA